jgi:hypothetical protein
MPHPFQYSGCYYPNSDAVELLVNRVFKLFAHQGRDTVIAPSESVEIIRVVTIPNNRKEKGLIN